MGRSSIWTKIWLTARPLTTDSGGLSSLEPSRSRPWRNGGEEARLPHTQVQLRPTYFPTPSAFSAGLNFLNLLLTQLWKCSCLLVKPFHSPSGELTCFTSLPPSLAYGSAGYSIAPWPENQWIRKGKGGKLSSTLVTWGGSWNQCPQRGFCVSHEFKMSLLLMLPNVLS